MTQGGEEARELIATIRGEHVAMKQWFMGSSPEAVALRRKWGAYPGMWKEVLNWKGWKEARKAYLAHQQQSERGGPPAPSSSDNGQSGVPRKRKSRWGSVEDKAPRRSRWAAAGPPAAPVAPTPYAPSRNQPNLPGLPGMPANLPPHQRREMSQLQGRLREVNDRLQNVERDAARVDALPRGHRDRSPSPPPVYGPDGKRKNTRAVRWRDRYTAERQDLLEKLMNLNPATRHNSLFRRKRTKKIPIPIEEHPNYNFIGLIIGPRGKTQKELEAKTGCKIAIRGKGSVKEGARGRRDGKVMEGDDEPLHVVITGEDQKSVDAATDMIQQMLVVIDDEKNLHKQAQLRELALLNGTLKEEEFCQICAEKGHRAFECPKRFSNKSKVVVRCAICGDTSHPTRDCTQRAQVGQEGNKNDKELDSDYASFMAELDGKKVEAKKPDLPPAAPPAEPAGLTILKPANPVPAPPPTALPAVPGGAPPPLPNLPPPPTNLPPPPPPAAAAAVPPPPPANLPPPHAPQQYGGYQAQQPAQGGGYNHQNHQGYGSQYYQQNGNAQQQQQQHYQGQRYGGGAEDETAGWDYKSYYGQAGASSNAGGFNWWEQG